jgi:polysaccharide biosynthesis protein PslH
MRILQLRKWLSTRDDNGGKMRATGLARALSQFAIVDVVGFSTENEATLRNAGHLACYERLHPVTRESPARRAMLAAVELGRGGSLRSANFASAAYRGCVQAALASTPYDALQVEELSIFANLPAPSTAVPVVYSAHNVESALASQLLRLRGTWLTRLGSLDQQRAATEERRALEMAPFCLAVSDADKDDLQRLHAPHGAHIHVVPNCVDDQVAAADPTLAAMQQPRRVVFAACFSWYPNIEATRWFLTAVMPHLRRIGPPCTVDFVGSGIAPDLARTIHAAGCVAHADVAEMRPHLERARVAMIPLRSGSGTRIKIVEAWASGVPVVSTALGAAGLDARPDIDVLLADEPEAFAQSLSRALTDDALYTRLRSNGLQRAASMRWTQQAPILAPLYAALS